jgi:microtubule organizer protein 1
MQDMLKSDFTHNYIEEALKDGDEGKDSIFGKTNEKVIDMDWVIAIEETLPYIQKAIDEQRRFIKQAENVVRIKKAKKILTVEREEGFAIYENRVLLTLIHKALMFVDDKYSKMKDVPNDSYNNITMNRHLELNQQKLDFSVNYVNENHESLAEDLDVEDIESLSDFDRIRRIRQGLNECLATPLMKEIAKEPQVKPPLTQTNLLKENPNFKKAVELWSFLDTYKKQGFELVGEEYNGKMTDENKEDVYLAMEFQHFMMSITTNPALRKMLQEKYEEENALAKEEADRPEKVKEMVLEAQTEAVRKEEIEKLTAEITELKQKIAEQKQKIEEQANIINTQEGKIAALENERESHAKQVEQMNADFAEKTRIAEENFANRLSAKQKEFDDAQTAHNEYVTKLNTDNANKIAELNTNHSNEVAQLKSDYENRIDTINKENATATANLKSDYEGQLTSMKADYTSQIKNYEKQIADINAENAKNVKELNDNHAKEIKTITKESEKRMADFEKETTKKMNDTIADVKKKAKDEVRQAEKTAKEKIAEAKGENKLFKKKKEVFEAAYAAGSVGLMAMLAEKYASEGRTDFADHLVSATAAIRAIMIAPTPKGITLTMYTHGSAKLLKLYAGVTRYDVAIGDTVSSFGGVEGQPVFISFAGVGSEVADEIAGKIKETADCKVTVSQNRRIQSTGIIGIYFCGE